MITHIASDVGISFNGLLNELQPKDEALNVFSKLCDNKFIAFIMTSRRK